MVVLFSVGARAPQFIRFALPVGFPKHTCVFLPDSGTRRTSHITFSSSVVSESTALSQDFQNRLQMICTNEQCKSFSCECTSKFVSSAGAARQIEQRSSARRMRLLQDYQGRRAG